MDREPRPHAALDPETGSFIIEGYNWAAPFSSFLPGIAGLFGVPTWAYYVSRGQAMASFGVRDKNGQILEFQSFNQACMRVAEEGFRTFLRFEDGTVHEPFVKTEDPDVEQQMRIRPEELVLRERHRRLGLEIEACYFGVPNMRVAALARQVRLRNTGDTARSIDWVDGLGRILPYGLDQARIKGIPRHIEGMMGIGVHAGTPLFRLKQTPDDSERVGAVVGGHFYLASGASIGQGMVVDPEAVFGDPFDLGRPWAFERAGARGVLESPQAMDNRTPAAMTVRTDTLAPGASVRLESLFGYVRRDEDVEPLAAALSDEAFLDGKREENRDVIAEVADHAFTASASREFDAYAGQTFLDNVVRGGMPLLFDTHEGKSAFYVYSRQNGDLERDYHHFVLEPSYLSQGTGHYRSVLQNRRADPWFFPGMQTENLHTFMNLIQLDGYNPLEVRGTSYRTVDAEGVESWLEEHVPADARDGLRAWLAEGFTPGELALRLEDMGTAAPADGWMGVLEAIVALSEPGEVGGLHEGFWVDHWHYNIDLLEILAGIYPDRLEHFLLGERDYTYFDDPDVVVPRSGRSVDAGGRVRNWGAVQRDPEKVARIEKRAEARYTVRTRYGDGDVYRTHLLSKLLTLVVHRLATLDPAGHGVEMEAGKPGWNDSMNGLPGLFGSGLSETSELRRTVRLLRRMLADMSASRIPIHAELVAFLRALAPLIRERLSVRTEDGALSYWDASNALKEAYRAETRFGVDGREVELDRAELEAFLADAQGMLDQIFEHPIDEGVMADSGVPHTYFVNEVVRHESTGKTSPAGYPTVVPRAFSPRPVRAFLEGAVHWMKDRPEEAKAVYDAVQSSPLFDRELGMYKSCEDMTGEDPELGRAVGAYPRGWIENESIYLHMEYKYLLEILRSGLCREFWSDARSALVPFMDPEVYGRSTLEGASFIVSSAYADPRLHGRAFQPRLSGITCEFLHMWIVAVAGERPFRLEGTELRFALEPRLPGWLFTEEPSRRRYHDPTSGWSEVELGQGSFAFKLLGHTLVVYDNRERLDTFGADGCTVTAYRLSYRDGTSVEENASGLGSEHAAAVRDGSVRRIDVTLARR